LGGIVTDAILALPKKELGMLVLPFRILQAAFQINLYNEKFESYKHLITKGQVLYMSKEANEKRLFSR
jgi:hypothetical protein